MGCVSCQAKGSAGGTKLSPPVRDGLQSASREDAHGFQLAAEADLNIVCSCVGDVAG